MNIPIKEQETTIVMLRDSDMARIYTCDTTVMTKLDKKCAAEDSPYKLEYTDGTASRYLVPKRLIRFGTPRVINDSERKLRAERLRGMRRDKQ